MNRILSRHLETWAEKLVDGEDTIKLINLFWREHRKLSRHGPNEKPGEFRCPWCNRIYKTEISWTRHKTKCTVHRQIRNLQLHKGSKADRLVQRKKCQQLLASMPAIMMEDIELENVICAEYLGHLSTRDGDCSEDVDSRMQKARRCFNKMKWLWQDSDLGQELKLRIFVRGVVSILVYGSEAWRLTPKILTKLNGWNSRCLAIITGNTPRAEARIRTQTMDIGGIIRCRRKVWLGHILRSDPQDLGRQDVLATAELERRDEMDGVELIKHTQLTDKILCQQ